MTKATKITKITITTDDESVTVEVPVVPWSAPREAAVQRLIRRITHDRARHGVPVVGDDAALLARAVLGVGAAP